jgi:hypothetical protein
MGAPSQGRQGLQFAAFRSALHRVAEKKWASINDAAPRPLPDFRAILMRCSKCGFENRAVPTAIRPRKFAARLAFPFDWGVLLFHDA